MPNILKWVEARAWDSRSQNGSSSREGSSIEPLSHSLRRAISPSGAVLSAVACPSSSSAIGQLDPQVALSNRSDPQHTTQTTNTLADTHPPNETSQAIPTSAPNEPSATDRFDAAVASLDECAGRGDNTRPQLDAETVTKQDKKSESLKMLAGLLKTSLEGLKTVSDVIPLPWFGTVVEAACNVVEIVEAVKGNMEEAAALGERIRDTMRAVVISLRDKRPDQIPEWLKDNVISLSSILQSILEDIRKTDKGNDGKRILELIKQAILREHIKGIIAKGRSRLDQQLQTFFLRCQIESPLALEQMSQTMTVLYDMVRAALENRDISQQADLPLMEAPPKPASFYGRDVLVAEAVDHIMGESAARIGILGAGGIGKTAVASAIVHHQTIKDCFGSRRHWASCEASTTVALLIETVAQSLGVAKASANRLNDITAHVNSQPEPRLLVLDNFETPLDIQGKESAVIDILAVLFTIPLLSIVVTMRGTLPGVGQLPWTHRSGFALDVLPITEARRLYLDINPEAQDDPQLDTLLGDLGCLPLAVKLVATVGSKGETPTQLLHRWHTEGVKVARQGRRGDRRTNLEMSIELSLQSNLVKSDPDAIRLLSVIAFLPGGVRSEILSNLVPSISSPRDALFTLLDACLIYSTNNNAYNVLPPVRSDISSHHRISAELLSDVHKFYIEYLGQHNPLKLGQEAFEAISREELNLEHILLAALRTGPAEKVIEVANSFAWYQTQMRPRLDVINAAIKACRDASRDRLLLACLETAYVAFHNTRRYGDAIVTCTEAVDLSRRLGNARASTYFLCELAKVYVNLSRLEDARAALGEALKACRGLNDRTGLAECLFQQAHLNIRQCRYNEAWDGYQKAREEFVALGEFEKVAECLWSLAHQMYEHLGYHKNAAKVTLHLIEATDHTTKNQIEASRAKVEEVKKLQEEYGDPDGLARCLDRLGGLALDEEGFDDARNHFKEERDIYMRLDKEYEVAYCDKRIAHVDMRVGRFEDARSLLESALPVLLRLGAQDDAAECLRWSGEVAFKQNNPVEGRRMIIEAKNIWKRLGLANRVAECDTLLT